MVKAKKLSSCQVWSVYRESSVFYWYLTSRVSNYCLADVTMGETPHKQENIPSSLKRPQEGKILSGLVPSEVGSKQAPHGLSVPQD